MTGIPTGDCENPAVVFNSLARERSEVIELPNESLAMVRVPACGYAVVSGQEAGEPDAPIAPVTAQVDGQLVRMSNGLIELCVGGGGQLESVRDLETGREVLDGSGNEFHLLRDYPNRWNAWDVEASAMEDYEVVNGADPPLLVESGPLRAVVGIQRSFGASSLAQRIILRAGSKRIDFETTVVCEALALNTPLLVREAPGGTDSEGERTRSWLSIDQPGVVVEAFKKAEDGKGLILRLSEAFGTRRTIVISSGLPLAVTEEVDLLERTSETWSESKANPLELQAFDLRTFRLQPDR